MFAEPDRSSGIDVLERLAQRDLREDRGYVATLDRLRPELDFDARFADAIRGRPVILGFGFTYEAQQIGALPPPLFRAQDIGGGIIPIQPAVGYTAAIAELTQAAAGSGHVDPFFDADNVVRRVPMVELYRNAYYPALSLAIARVVLEAKRVTPHFDSDQRLDGFDIGGLALPTAADGTALIPFRGKPKTFRYYSAADVLAGSAPADFAGAIALVGTTAKGLQDLRPTPLAADFPGVEIHASLLSGMLNQDLKSVPANANAIEALIMLLTGLVVLFVIPYRDPVFNALGVVAVMGLVAAANLLLWIKLNEVVPVAATLLMLAVLFGWNMLAGFMREERKIRRVSAMFGEYVPRERVAQMVESGERYSMVGESRTMTVLFCDVRDFTALSENLPPRELSAMLNAYLTPMTEIIHAQHGTVDKYVGDAIMAFWGAPIDNPNHARDAVARRAGDAAQNVVAGRGVQEARLAGACHRRRHQQRRDERRRHGLRIPQGLHGARRRGQPRVEARGLDQGVRRRRHHRRGYARRHARHPLSRNRSRARQGQGEPGHDIRAAAGSGRGDRRRNRGVGKSAAAIPRAALCRRGGLARRPCQRASGHAPLRLFRPALRDVRRGATAGGLGRRDELRYEIALARFSIRRSRICGNRRRPR